MKKPNSVILTKEEQIDTIKKAKIISLEIQRSKYKMFLTQYIEKELLEKAKYIIVSPTKKAGAVVTKDKDITSVFNNSSERGEGTKMLMEAIEKGGRTLDHIDGYLSKVYEKMGFEEVKKMKWDDKYAPKGWDYKKDDKPDIIFRKLNLKKYEQFKNR